METSATGNTSNAGGPNVAAQLTARSWRGVAMGLLVALLVPTLCLALAWLLGSGLVPYDQLRALVNPWFGLALAEVLLGPIGVGIALWSAGVRGAALVALIVVALPVLVVVWFLCLATLSGAMGEPF
jgi:hypothetical protein